MHCTVRGSSGGSSDKSSKSPPARPVGVVGPRRPTTERSDSDDANNPSYQSDDDDLGDQDGMIRSGKRKRPISVSYVFFSPSLSLLFFLVFYFQTPCHPHHVPNQQHQHQYITTLPHQYHHQQQQQQQHHLLHTKINPKSPIFQKLTLSFIDANYANNERYTAAAAAAPPPPLSSNPSTNTIKL